jgi:hypothetical protein
MSCVVTDLVAAELSRVHERSAGRFTRTEPRARVRSYVSGLAAGLHRRTVWWAIASPVPPDRKVPVRAAPVREAVAGWIDEMLREGPGRAA